MPFWGLRRLRTSRAKRQGFCEHSFMLVFGFITNHRKSRALFSRAVAELKYMGMINSSSRKADHVAKLLWKGL